MNRRLVFASIALPENSVPNVAFITDDFTGLICATSHQCDARVILGLLVRQEFKHGVFSQLLDLPIVKVFDVGDRVDKTARFNHVGVV